MNELPNIADPGPLAQSDAPSDWYSGGRGHDPGSGHIAFLEILSWNDFYGNSLPTADSSRAVASYWWKYGHLVLLVNRLGSLSRNSVDWLAWHDFNSVDWAVKPSNKQTNKQYCRHKMSHVMRKPVDPSAQSDQRLCCSLLMGYGIWFDQFLIIAYLFTLDRIIPIHAISKVLRLYLSLLVCVIPGRKPRRQGFSGLGSKVSQ